MEDRTVTISQLGKKLSASRVGTIGWAVGPAALVNAVNQAHQFITYAVAAPLQAAAWIDNSSAAAQKTNRRLSASRRRPATAQRPHR